ncbi:DedA family protein [Antrihabitans stalactiti]|uniref:DedA family protein n=1 Tax=Antrihabitans stalactiti TaxID=2584121 RepID=A0A848KQ33_9NOCA|nr:DedA family protein [Antrihabitans stalactiti]NMN99034.1 DedA family protein [Antrihabitans stalactiti]
MTTAMSAGLLNPDTLVSTFGLIGILATVFVESGLLLGFFLPGDSLLFTAGVLVAQPNSFVPLWVLLLTVPLAAILGDQCGYVIGRAAGPPIFERPTAKRLGPAQLARAHAYFDKYGPRTVILARFVPVVRTVIPVMAGAADMRYREFTLYNIVGGLAWGTIVPTLGYWLGGIDFVRAHIELILIAVVVLSVAPLIANYARAALRQGRRPAEPSVSADTTHS